MTDSMENISMTSTNFVDVESIDLREAHIFFPDYHLDITVILTSLENLTCDVLMKIFLNISLQV